jgi:hypothetical protein
MKTTRLTVFDTGDYGKQLENIRAPRPADRHSAPNEVNQIGIAKVFAPYTLIILSIAPCAPRSDRPGR